MQSRFILTDITFAVTTLCLNMFETIDSYLLHHEFDCIVPDLSIFLRVVHALNQFFVFGSGLYCPK
jgi:hypothetical protein